MVSGLSEDSARFPIIGADLSEPSAYLPLLRQKTANELERLVNDLKDRTKILG